MESSGTLIAALNLKPEKFFFFLKGTVPPESRPTGEISIALSRKEKNSVVTRPSLIAK
jgi:hypothetical protein